jgi:hypothetical protein
VAIVLCVLFPVAIVLSVLRITALVTALLFSNFSYYHIRHVFDSCFIKLMCVILQLQRLFLWNFCVKEELEDTKGVIGIRKSKKIRQ